MLQELYIKNIALIRELSVSFQPGLNVLSGETGAGKSILVDSVQLILGGRSDRELIRHGEEKAFVQAQFDLCGCADGFFDALRDQGLDEEDTLVVSRELTVAGKNVCRMNGQLVSLGVLKSLMSRLLSLHGQNQQQSLMDVKSHLQVLDRYIGAPAAEALKSVQAAYEDYVRVLKQLQKLVADTGEKDRLLDLLQYQAREIEQAKLTPGEDDALLAEKRRMLNAERIALRLQTAREAVKDAGGALETLSQAAHALHEIEELDERYAKLATVLDDAYYAVDDAAYELADCAEEILYDPARLDDIEERLAAISALKRKYGATIEEVLAFGQDCAARCAQLEDSTDALARLESELAKLRGQLEQACAVLTNLRRKNAAKLEQEIVAQFAELGMPDARFAVDFSPRDFSANGADVVEFLMITNPGEPFKPLAKIASGGEASRIMLAIQNILAGREEVRTLIFDEIDAGISGRMARVVAEKLALLGMQRQVVCVTHLPQIAAMGNTNFLIEKQRDDAGAKTTVAELTGQEREREIARLSGGTASDKALAHARELLQQAHAFRARC